MAGKWDNCLNCVPRSKVSREMHAYDLSTQEAQTGRTTEFAIVFLFSVFLLVQLIGWFAG